MSQFNGGENVVDGTEEQVPYTESSDISLTVRPLYLQLTQLGLLSETHLSGYVSSDEVDSPENNEWAHLLRGNVMIVGPSVYDSVPVIQNLMWGSEGLESNYCIGVDPVYEILFQSTSFDDFKYLAESNGFVPSDDSFKKFYSLDWYHHMKWLITESEHLTRYIPFGIEECSTLLSGKSFQHIWANQVATNYFRYNVTHDIWKGLFSEWNLNHLEVGGEIRIHPFYTHFVEDKSDPKGKEFQFTMTMISSRKNDRSITHRFSKNGEESLNWINANDTQLASSSIDTAGLYLSTLMNLSKGDYRIFCVEKPLDVQSIANDILHNYGNAEYLSKGFRKSSVLIVTKGRNAKIPYSYGNKIYELFPSHELLPPVDPNIENFGVEQRWFRMRKISQ